MFPNFFVLYLGEKILAQCLASTRWDTNGYQLMLSDDNLSQTSIPTSNTCITGIL